MEIATSPLTTPSPTSVKQSSKDFVRSAILGITLTLHQTLAKPPIQIARPSQCSIDALPAIRDIFWSTKIASCPILQAKVGNILIITVKALTTMDFAPNA
jgi:hypothetical protein